MPRSPHPKLRDTILKLLPKHPKDLVSVTASRLGVSRAAVSGHIRKLEQDGYLRSEGTTRKTYHPNFTLWRATLDEDLDEARVWQEHFQTALADLPKNQFDLLHHGLTEMLNNVIDHSGARKVASHVVRSEAGTLLFIADDGEGIFRKISRLQKLPDEKLALLELAKGKLTTDPKRHSGEGIFFTSRMFDRFLISSGELLFSHDPAQDFLTEHALEAELEKHPKGTVVVMYLDSASTRTAREIFDAYAAPEEFTFSKTVVPLRMASLGGENLVSRSQAKRALGRLSQFKSVLFDFSEVELIGQGFADEIFRVFANAHPDIELLAVHCNEDVRRMLLHVGILTKQILKDSPLA